MSATPFDDPVQFETIFTDGLRRLAQESDLGVFILAAANASSEAGLFADLTPHLQAQFDRLRTDLRQELLQGKCLRAPQDDLIVFLQLTLMEMSALQVTEERRLGPWIVQFNALRALRPGRATSRKDIRLALPFDANGFHFDRDFLRREVFWEGQLDKLPVRLLYNKFPFARMHAILVPEPARHLPQFLTARHHRYAFSLVKDLAAGLPGLGLAYNSLGAYASVNHLHFQLFVEPAGLPVHADQWQHNGGANPYPANCRAYNDADRAWEAIDSLHRQGRAYNLLYTGGRVLVFPRPAQDTREPPSWGPGFAWYEMCGAVVTSNRDTFEQLRAEDISAALAQASSFDPIADATPHQG